MGNPEVEVGSGFVFFVGAGVFCLHGKQSRQGLPQGRAGTSGRRCISAPLWTSKHGFEKRSFEKPLSAPYSFLNKAHFLVLIPAVLKTIARFKKSRALALLTLFPFWRVKHPQLPLDL